VTIYGFSELKLRICLGICLYCIIKTWTLANTR